MSVENLGDVELDIYDTSPSTFDLLPDPKLDFGKFLGVSKLIQPFDLFIQEAIECLMQQEEIDTNDSIIYKFKNEVFEAVVLWIDVIVVRDANKREYGRYDFNGRPFATIC